MRSTFLISLALVTVTGCTTGDLSYEHTANLGVDSRGVAFTDDDSAQVGMNGVTCAIDPDTASINEDVDVVDEDDKVEDAYEGEALIANSNGVAFYTPENYDWNDTDWAPDILVPSLQSAGFTAGGTATLDAFQGCNVSFHTGAANQIALNDESCVGGELASSGDLDMVLAATEFGGFLVTQAGDIHDLGSASHVALDGSGVAYTADGTTLTAFNLDATERWSMDLAGDIIDLDVLAGHAAVMLEMGNGSGELITFSADTGEMSSSLPTPTPAQEIAASDSGREIAMVLPFEIHFFEVSPLN